MKEQEILEEAAHNSRPRGLGVAYIFIEHPRNPGIKHYVSGQVKMHCDDGVWRTGVLYNDKHGNEYCRRTDDFEKFEVAHD